MSFSRNGIVFERSRLNPYEDREWLFTTVNMIDMLVFADQK